MERMEKNFKEKPQSTNNQPNESEEKCNLLN